MGAWLSSLVVAWALLGGMSDPRQLSMQESFGRAGQRSGVVRPTAQRPRASRVVYGANGDTRLDEMQGWVFEDEGEEGGAAFSLVQQQRLKTNLFINILAMTRVRCCPCP